ncbi:MAG: CvpA family protein [Candidatus Omnitrophica bacterium]|nr:CvpA family protein [Candidatus Omnitrophota bacterium]
MTCICAACIFKGRKSGLFPEFINLTGVLFATFFSIHYYLIVSARVKQYVTVKLSEPLFHFVVFAVIALVVMGVFVVVRKGWLIILKIETMSFINKYGGILIAGMKGYMLCCLVFLSLIISGNEIARYNSRKSLSSLIMANTSVNIYSACYSRIVNRFFPNEGMNKKVFKVLSRRNNN